MVSLGSVAASSSTSVIVTGTFNTTLYKIFTSIEFLLSSNKCLTQNLLIVFLRVFYVTNK